MSIFTIEGGIGSGKTSLLGRLPTTLPDGRKLITLLEPVQQWVDFKSSDSEVGLFELYYNDKRKYGFIFQMLALQTRIEDLCRTVRENPGAVIICERCYITDKELFAKMLYDDGYINELEYKVYLKWFDFVYNTLKMDIKGIVYLQVEPAVCAARIMKRNRVGEQAIALDYLQKLHDHHERWILSIEKKETVLVVNGNDVPDITAIIEFIGLNSCII